MKRILYIILFNLFVFFIGANMLQAQAIESWDFESNTIGDVLNEIGWGAADIEAEVADDPVATGNNVLKNTIHNYNAAPVLKFVLPAGKTIADYTSFTFKGYFAQGDVGYKNIIVEAYDDMPTGQAYNVPENAIGSFNRAQMGSTGWEDITIDITNTKTFTDTVFIAFGINCAGTGDVGGTGVTTIWYADDVTLVAAAVAEDLVSLWGRTSQGALWPILSEGAGEVSFGGGDLGSSWATVRGAFDELEATTDQAVVVTGKIELVGGNGGSTYTPLRYAITYHADDTLNYAGTDSAIWVRGPGWGYGFHPRSGGGTMSNGNGGSGTVWTVVNGSWSSSYSNGGPGPLAAINQAPRNAELIAGTYNFAISVLKIDDTTNQVKWYLVEENNKYWFGGTVTDTATTFNFNGFSLGVNTGGWTQVNLSEVKAELGDPIDIPEAPWESYYIDLWGQTPQGNYWPVQNDSSTLVGDGSIAGTEPINGAGQASIRGGFGQELPIKSDQALIVRGELELVGTIGGESSYNPLRFAITYNPDDTLRYALTDSANWVRSPSWGYIFTPRTGSGTVANGSWGSGTVGIVNNGNWHSTNSNGGPALATILQAPRNAQMIPGTYEWAISVHQVNDTTNEIRWYLIEEDNKYWFGGVVQGAAVTDVLTGINFNLNTGDWTELNVIAAEVDYGDPITIPIAPWEQFYIPVANWGFYGDPSTRQGGWTLEAGPVDGNVSISGSGPVAANQWAAIRGSFGEAVSLNGIPQDTALVITGSLEFVGGGFEGWSGIRFGVFYTDSAGVVDSTESGPRWTGPETYNSGYLFIPQVGTNDDPTWGGPGGTASVGAVVDASWLSTNGANNYKLDSTTTGTGTASAGTYDFKLSFRLYNNDSIHVGYSIKKDDGSYAFEGWRMDKHDPLATTKFNSINFAVNSTNATTTALNITDVLVDLGSPVLTSANGPEENKIPVVYSLAQNYPNPFNPTTTINFALPKSSEVTLKVYDILGRVVANLVDGKMDAGNHSVNFDASNLASGVYFYKLEAGDFSSVKKLMLLK